MVPPNQEHSEQVQPSRLEPSRAQTRAARPNRRIRAAIVGAGYVANHHLRAVRGLPFVDLGGIADQDAAQRGGAVEFDVGGDALFGGHAAGPMVYHRQTRIEGRILKSFLQGGRLVLGKHFRSVDQRHCAGYASGLNEYASFHAGPHWVYVAFVDSRHPDLDGNSAPPLERKSGRDLEAPPSVP